MSDGPDIVIVGSGIGGGHTRGGARRRPGGGS